MRAAPPTTSPKKGKTLVGTPPIATKTASHSHHVGVDRSYASFRVTEAKGTSSPPSRLIGPENPARKSPTVTVDQTLDNSLLIQKEQKQAPTEKNASRSVSVSKKATLKAPKKKSKPPPISEEEEKKLLLKALAECDDLSEDSYMSVDLGDFPEICPDQPASPTPQAAPKPAVATRKKKKAGNPTSLTEEEETKQILTLALEIAQQQPHHSHRNSISHRRSFLYLHLHTSVKCKLAQLEAAHGPITCIAVSPVPPSPCTSTTPEGQEPPPTIDRLVAFAVGTARGRVMLYDHAWSPIVLLSIPSRRVGIQSISIAVDRSSLICSTVKMRPKPTVSTTVLPSPLQAAADTTTSLGEGGVSIWALNVPVKTEGVRLKRVLACQSVSKLLGFAAPANSETHGRAFRWIQHLHGVQYGMVGVEALTGAVFLVHWRCVMGRPFFARFQCVDQGTPNPTTSHPASFTAVDAFPCPSEYLIAGKSNAARVKHDGLADSSLLALLAHQEAELSFWSREEYHIILTADAFKVTAYYCGFPSLTSVPVATWTFPRPCTSPPFIHWLITASEESEDKKRMHVLVTGGQCLYQFVLQPSAEVASSPELLSWKLVLRVALPTTRSASACITGLWCVGSGSDTVLVFDSEKSLTLVDVSAGASVEQYQLPHSDPRFAPPQNALCGPRGASASVFISALAPSAYYASSLLSRGVLLFTDKLFVLSATLRSWQERLEFMLHHQEFIPALECLRDMALHVSVDAGGGGSESHTPSSAGRASSMPQRELANYVELVCLSYISSIVLKKDSERGGSATNCLVAPQVQQAVIQILSFSQPPLLQRVFWHRFIPYCRATYDGEEFFDDVLKPVLRAVKVGMGSGQVCKIPAAQVPFVIQTLLADEQASKHVLAPHDTPERASEQSTSSSATPPHQWLPAAREAVEPLLLRLSGDGTALLEAAKVNRLIKLGTHLLAFHWHEYLGALQYALTERPGDYAPRQPAPSTAPMCSSSSVALSYLHCLVEGKTFVPVLPFPARANSLSGLLEVWQTVFTLSTSMTGEAFQPSRTVMGRLLRSDCLGATQVLLQGICRLEEEKDNKHHRRSSSTPASSKADGGLPQAKCSEKEATSPQRKASACVPTSAFMLALFLHLMLLAVETYVADDRRSFLPIETYLKSLCLEMPAIAKEMSAEEEKTAKPQPSTKKASLKFSMESAEELLHVVSPLLFRLLFQPATPFISSSTSSPEDLRRGVEKESLYALVLTLLPFLSGLQTRKKGVSETAKQACWLPLLPLLGRLSILLFQAANRQETRQKLQMFLSDYLCSSSLSQEHVCVWEQRCLAAGMVRAAAALCFYNSRYDVGLDYYLDPHYAIQDPMLPGEVFVVLRKEMMALTTDTRCEAVDGEKEGSGETGPARTSLIPPSEIVSPVSPRQSRKRRHLLYAAVINHAVGLENVDRAALVSFYLQYCALSEQDLYMALGESSEKLLLFLEVIVRSQDDALQGNEWIQNLYIDLLCLHSPNKVYAYLRDNSGNISYDSKAVLKSCQTYEVYAGIIYLLISAKRFDEALRWVFRRVREIMTQLELSHSQNSVEVVEGNVEVEAATTIQPSSNAYEPWEREGEWKRKYPALLEVLQLGITIGQEVNNTKVWMKLLNLFESTSRKIVAIKASKHETGGESRASKTQTANQLMSLQHFTLWQSGEAMVLEAIARSFGSASVFSKLVANSLPSRWMPFLLPVMRLLQVEVQLYEGGASVARGDARQAASLYLEAKRKGVLSTPLEESSTRSGSSLCTVCFQSLQRRRQFSNEIIDQPICLFPCGHAAHTRCLPSTTDRSRSTVEWPNPFIQTQRCVACFRQQMAIGVTSSSIDGKLEHSFPSLPSSLMVPEAESQKLGVSTGTSDQAEPALERDKADEYKHLYQHMRRIRAKLDMGGDRFSAMKNILSALPPPKHTRASVRSVSPSTPPPTPKRSVALPVAKGTRVGFTPTKAAEKGFGALGEGRRTPSATTAASVTPSPIPPTQEAPRRNEFDEDEGFIAQMTNEEVLRIFGGLNSPGENNGVKTPQGM